MPSVHPTSAGDWTTFLKRKAGVQHGKTVVFADGTAPTNRDINPVAPGQCPANTPVLGSRIPRDVGGSRIRRTASDYTNFVASRFAERTLNAQGSGRAGENGDNTGARTEFRIRVCNCTQEPLSAKSVVCVKCLGR
jgi:hypothetical protein